MGLLDFGKPKRGFAGDLAGLGALMETPRSSTAWPRGGAHLHHILTPLSPEEQRGPRAFPERRKCHLTLVTVEFRNSQNTVPLYWPALMLSLQFPCARHGGRSRASQQPGNDQILLPWHPQPRAQLQVSSGLGKPSVAFLQRCLPALLGAAAAEVPLLSPGVAGLG